MKLRRIEIKAAGCTVALNFKQPVDVNEDTDVLSVLDHHARQIQNELTKKGTNDESK